MHAEALVLESDFPEPFAVMATGAIVERHLRLLGTAHGIPVNEDSSKGSINYYLGELQRRRVVSVGDARQLQALGDSRNDAAHGWFERIDPGNRTPRSARSSFSASCGTPSLMAPEVRALMYASSREDGHS